MPARRDYTAAELRQRLAHEREQSRIRQARYRARLRDRGRDENAGHGNAGAPLLPPVASLLGASVKEQVAAARAILRGFADRGYVDAGRFWAKAAEKYPDLDLELEALKVKEWLDQPRNAKRLCSTQFLDGWLRRAHAGTLRAADPVAIASPRPMVIANGTPYHQPITQQGRNPGPPDLPLFEAPVQRIDDGEMARFIAGRRDIPLAEKLKAKNGAHK